MSVFIIERLVTQRTAGLALSGNGGEAPKRVRWTKQRGAEVNKRENCEALQASKATYVCEGVGGGKADGCGDKFNQYCVNQQFNIFDKLNLLQQYDILRL